MALACAALVLLALSPGALPSPGQAGSHEPWLREVRSAGARSLATALQTYDVYLREHPADVTAAVERCELISGALDREREEDEPDPALPTLEDCAKDLERGFPHSPAAVISRLGFTRGQQAISLGEQALADPQIAFTDRDRAQIYRMLSQAQQTTAHPDAAARAARKAMSLDRSLDLTLIVGQRLLDEGRKTEALVTLSSRAEGTGFELQGKARKLADAGSFFRAQWLMGVAAAKPGFAADAALQARIYEGAGKPQQAREAYSKQRTAWNREDVLPQLFRLELAGSDAGAAERAYQELRDLGWKADPLARHRLELQWRFHAAKWRARDFAGVGALVACLVGFSLLPLLLLLPLHAWILWRRLQLPRPESPPPPDGWWFRHAYLAGALSLLAQLGALYLFAYDELALWIVPLKHSEATTPSIARFGLWYSVAQAVGLALLLLKKPRRLRLLGPGSWSLPKCVGQTAVALCLGYLAGYAGFFLSKAGTAALTVDGLVRSMVQTFGIGVALLAVAVLIPIGEELIFRSILLDVFARHLKFWVANLLQSLLFAALHADPARLVFYTVMGLLSGRMRRASGGLLSSILYHSANNAIALLLLSAIGTLGDQGLRKPKVAVAPDPELVACARGPAASRPKGDFPGLSLNDLAWSVAIDKSSSPPCLLKAEEAVETALQQLPEAAAYLDTKAMVLYREGRLDEAIDLERAAADRSQRSIYFSQLDRFLQARQAGKGPVLLGATAPEVNLASAPGVVVVALQSAFPDGFVLYARQAGGGALLQLSAGVQHERSYRVPVPGFPADARFELALIDVRGCEDCADGHWHSRVARHDAEVDRYP